MLMTCRHILKKSQDGWREWVKSERPLKQYYKISPSARMNECTYHVNVINQTTSFVIKNFGKDC